MRVGRVLSFAVVGLASVIVIAAGAIALNFFAQSCSAKQQNFAPPEGQKAVSPTSDTVLLSQTSGNSSFLYRKNPHDGTSVRLTSAAIGVESEASFSHNGKLVVYSFAKSADSKSAVWVVGIDGSNPHPLTGNDEDALHPVFSPDDSKVFYAASSFTGHYSPVVRPARHDWDVFSISLHSNATTVSIAPTQITHASFYDLLSLDIAAAMRLIKRQHYRTLFMISKQYTLCRSRISQAKVILCCKYCLVNTFVAHKAFAAYRFVHYSG